MIRVKLFEEAAVWLDDKPVVFPYKKAEALFYYICQEQRTTREKAAALLWAENDLQTARKNLRNALYQIRKLLGQEVLLLKGNTRIEINLEWVQADVYELTGDHILERFTNTFLENYTIRNCPDYASWMERTRETYRKKYIEKADEFVRSCVWSGDFERIRVLVGRLYILRIVDESLYCRIMRAYLGNMQYSDALHVYRNLENLLYREQERKPVYETICLAEEIRERQERMLQRRRDKENSFFYGRSEELRQVILSSKSMLITGGIGIGKTAFLNRFIEMQEGDSAEIVKYTCYEAGIGLPYRPFLEICEILQGFLEEKRYPGQIQEQIRNEGCMAVRVGKMLETLIRKVIRETGKSLVLILDDFHWIDRESAVLLQNLIRCLDGEAVRFILSADNAASEYICRFSEDLIRDGILEYMELPAFTCAECAAYIQEQMPELKLDEERERILFQISEGRILFLTAIIWLIRQGDYEVFGGRYSVDEMMEKHFENIGPNERQILEILSCQVEFLTFRELQRAAELDEVTAARSLEYLIEIGMVQETCAFAGSGYGFERRYVKKKIYQKIPEEKRREYHRTIAYCILKEFEKKIEAYPYVIYHFREAGEIHKMYEYKMEYYIYYFTPMHEAYPDHMDCLENDIPWTRQFVDHETIREIVDEIRDLTKDKTDPEDEFLLMKTEFLYGRYALFSGNRSIGLDSIGRCEELAGKNGDSSYLYRCAIRRLFYLIEVRDLENVQPYLERVERRSYDSVQNRATYLRIKGLYEIKCREYEKARRTLESAMRNYDMISYEDASASLGRAICLNCLCEIAIEERDYAEALRLVSQSIECSRIMDRKYMNGWHYVNLMRIMYDQKKYATVYQYAELANNIFQRSGTVWGVGQMEMILSLTCMDERKYMEALDHLQNAYTYAMKAGYLQAPGILDRIAGQIRQIMEDEERRRFSGGRKRSEPDRQV